MPDNVGEMFYYGEVPWHKKGIQLPQPATAEEAIKAGRLNWRVRFVPIQTEERLARSIARRVAVVRDDMESGDPRAVLGVVHPEFCLLQNRDAVEVFDALLTAGQSSQQSGNPRPQRLYHTGGYLGNGEVIWMLAKLPTTITIAGKDDVAESYMLLTNSHDGTFAISFRLTTVRVVCQNTLALAMRGDKSSHVFRRAHKIGPAKLAAEAKEFYQFSLKAAAELGETFQKMHRTPFGPDEVESLVAKLLPLPRPPAEGSVAVSLRKQYETRLQKITEARKGIVTVFEKGCTNGFKILPAERTLWGALNAVTAFVDHKQAINGDRYAYILFGSGATLKQKAYDLALTQLPKEQLSPQ